MRMIRAILTISMLLGLIGIGTACSQEKLPLPVLSADSRAELETWLEKNGLPPEEYVVSKFTAHDIVFLGEYHRIRHDPVLVQDVIPLLHKRGVYSLGIEFLAAHDQPAIDSLLAAKTYDENRARRLFWNLWPWWGYAEYIGILEAAWRFNRQLPDDARPFRVVGLNGRQDWSHVWSFDDRNDADIMKKVFSDGDPDEVMAQTIRREILARGDKALIYSGINHAYTKFGQPVVDEKTGTLVRLVTTRMGNRIYAEIGERCCTVFLHAPWPAAGGYQDPEVYPADGVIDALFVSMAPDKRRCGFDVKDSPFGRLPAVSALWSHAEENFRLEMYCDGWIFQKPISQYEGVAVARDWFTEENRAEAIAQLANPEPKVKRRDRSLPYLTRALASDAEIPRRFARFQ